MTQRAIHAPGFLLLGLLTVPLLFLLLFLPAMTAGPTISARATPAPPARAAGLGAPTEAEARLRYPWPRRRAGYESLASRFPAPAGHARVPVAAGSYAEYLRQLPLCAPGTPVRDYSGALLPSSTAAALAVVDLDVGARDLQQCMDTLIRLRGEYHWWRRQAHRVRFRYAGGRYFGYADWSAGIRPVRRGARIAYEKTGRPWASRQSFQKYLIFMFAMTGTAHNVAEPQVPFARLEAGHFFVQPPPAPGSLGHAVVVLDVAKSPSGEVRALLGEGYTPAQDLHVLRAPGGGAWYRLTPGRGVKTPQWPAFSWAELRQFRY